MEVIKIRQRSWKSSWQKWVKIVKRVSKKEYFKNDQGFSGLKVVVACGYCSLLEEEERCEGCSLDEKRICSYSGDIHPRRPFWAFVFEMRKDEPDFTKALEKAQKVLAAIEDDGVRWGYLKEEERYLKAV